ncbi:hypothetical protein LWI28_025276 [Acer negundo]|uniref:Uncharacterized protein n=1 Tax=Acer negundo TaxID=4023 RepID=A0AAD5IH79_ACENE|nr:hypothetical protein LWI28_025276 [Acer negundo]
MKSVLRIPFLEIAQQLLVVMKWCIGDQVWLCGYDEMVVARNQVDRWWCEIELIVAKLALGSWFGGCGGLMDFWWICSGSSFGFDGGGGGLVSVLGGGFGLRVLVATLWCEFGMWCVGDDFFWVWRYVDDSLGLDDDGDEDIFIFLFWRAVEGLDRTERNPAALTDREQEAIDLLLHE